MSQRPGITELSNVPMFASVPAAELARLAAAAEVVVHEAGTAIVTQGDYVDDLFVILEGDATVELTTADGRMRRRAQLESGAILGEISAVAGGRREATVRANVDARTARIPRVALDELLAATPTVAERLALLAHARLRNNQLLSYLVEVLPNTTEEQLHDVVASMEWRPLLAGETLFAQGDEADAAYLLVSGRLHAYRTAADGTSSLIGEVGRGELVGEQTLFEGARRNATLMASRDSELAELPREAVPGLLAEHPRVAISLVRTVLRRARHTEQRVIPEVTLTLLAAHPEVDLDTFGDRLRAAMAPYARVAHLSSRHVDAALGRPGIAQSDGREPGGLRLARWFEDIEDDHDVVLLQADRSANDWTRRAVRTAEHVVVVADASQPPDPTWVDDLLATPGVAPGDPRRSLVLLHPPGVRTPRGTTQWLVPRRIDRHHHVRADAATADLGRLARHLAGAAVGVALSGGGARGFGHVGAVQVLREFGVPIDLLAGTSMGCAIGVVAALDHETHDGFLTDVADGFRKPLDYTLPVAGLVTGRRIATAIERLFDGRDIADLPIPFLGMSTDLTNSAAAVHRHGDVVRVVRASVAIPGVIPPVVIDEALHVDGGVLDNLPVGPARREVRTGTVIAVDVAPPRGPRPREDFGTSVSGWRQMRDHVLPGRRPARVPTIAYTALISMLAAAVRERDRAITDGVADLYLHLGKLPAGLLQFDALERVAAAGYEAALEPIRTFAATGRAGAGWPSPDLGGYVVTAG